MLQSFSIKAVFYEVLSLLTELLGSEADAKAFLHLFLWQPLPGDEFHGVAENRLKVSLFFFRETCNCVAQKLVTVFGCNLLPKTCCAFIEKGTDDIQDFLKLPGHKGLIVDEADLVFGDPTKSEVGSVVKALVATLLTWISGPSQKGQTQIIVRMFSAPIPCFSRLHKNQQYGEVPFPFTSFPYNHNLITNLVLSNNPLAKPVESRCKIIVVDSAPGTFLYKAIIRRCKEIPLNVVRDQNEGD